MSAGAVVPARWLVAPVDEDAVTRLAAALSVRRLTARILIGRGFSDAVSAGRFLSPRLSDLRAPDGIADQVRVVERLVLALTRGERIGVFGDYDVDGVTTAGVLTSALRALGVDVLARVASRHDGYGFRPQVAEFLCDQRCAVVLTGDCGTSDREALELCRGRGVDAVVIDHHHVPDGPSPAFALINPHRADDHFPFKGLASCGIAFYLMAALRTRLRESGNARAAAWDPRQMLDLVALGTVADMVPLREENRILVAAGLRELSARRRPGLRALMRISGVEEGVAVQASDIGFRLGPRLNAAGRLGDAQLALDLLLAPNDHEAQRLSEDLDGRNLERQRIQEEVWCSAVLAAEEQRDAPAIVVGREGWHAGVVGIVAAKLMERYRRPVIVVGFQDGVGRGSARTPLGLNLYESLADCQAHLTIFGGHAAAAGMTVTIEKFDAFRAAFQAAVHQRAATAAQDCLSVDAVADLDDLSLAQAEELLRLGPFGNGNAEPLFALVGVTASSTRIVGRGHLQLSVTHGQSSAEAIAFGMAEQSPAGGARLDLLVHADVDTFRGNRRARLRVKHLLGEGAA